jgi:CRISPR-associated protein Cmr1
MRRVDAAGPKYAPSERSGLINDSRSYEFITPVFGGGVRVEGHKKLHDPVTPVRAPSLRGQLRFWWRAVNPSRCADVASLRTREAKVFGSAAGGEKGTLDVLVRSQPTRHDELRVLKHGDKFKAEPGMEALAYGAFPLRDPQPGAQHGTLHEHLGAWEVVFRYAPELQDDIDAALWAWTHFGGLGGRVRRGFGAVAQVGGERAPCSLQEGWARWIQRGGRPAETPWPSLRGTLEASVAQSQKRHAKGIEALKTLLGSLRELRQGPRGRKHDGSKQGRSFWPEPDALRALTGQSEPHHRERITTTDAFPRWEFGTPIIFHFKDHGDPQGLHGQKGLQLVPKMNGKALGRLASQLILRPRVGNEDIEALALRIWHPAPQELTVGHPNERQKPLRANVTHDEAAAIKPLCVGDEVFTSPIERYFHLLRNGQ